MDTIRDEVLRQLEEMRRTCRACHLSEDNSNRCTAPAGAPTGCERRAETFIVMLEELLHAAPRGRS